MRVLMITLMALFVGASANAAVFNVKHYTDTGNSYIQMDGPTAAGDSRRLKTAYEAAIAGTAIFSEDLWLEGPGGDAQEAKRLVKMIDSLDLTTVVNGMCASACGYAWLAGKERWIVDDGMVGFHHPYSAGPDAAKWYDAFHSMFGWIGIQDHQAKTVTEYLAVAFEQHIARPAEFLNGLTKSTHRDMFWITNENVWITGNYGN